MNLSTDLHVQGAAHTDAVVHGGPVAVHGHGGGPRHPARRVAELDPRLHADRKEEIVRGKRVVKLSCVGRQVGRQAGGQIGAGSVDANRKWNRIYGKDLKR